MSEDDKPMNGPSSDRKRPSLIERAADVYDFDAALRGAGRAPVPAPPPTSGEPESAQPSPLPVPSPPVPAALGPGAFVPPVAAWSGLALPVDRERLSEEGIIQPEGDVTGTSEEFRIVKRRVLSAAFGADGKPEARGNFVLVSSAHAGEGKTWCAINLAISLAAEQDMDVLLVDADFGKPGICARLGLPEGPGLMDALVDPQMAVEQAVLRTDIPGLSVLPAGRQVRNDTEFVASDRTRLVLDRLDNREGRRIIIFDSPPALAASPVAELARHVGQILFVVRADRTTEAALRDSLNLLSACPVIRLLLNGVKFSSSGRQFGNYYGKAMP